MRFARGINPETLGFALLFARDIGICPTKILAFYRCNWILFSAPTLLCAELLLALAGIFHTGSESHTTEPSAAYPFGIDPFVAESLTNMFLLTTLFILEIAIEEMTIQRRTIILPLKAFPALERRSLSGLGTAASCILSLQTALLSIYVPAFAPRNYLFEFIVAGFCILLAALALLIYTILIAKGKISTCESSYRLYSLPSG